MTMITLHWQRCIKNSLWCQFSEKLLNNSRLETRFGDYSIGISGVYIIWTEAENLASRKAETDRNLQN